MDPLRIAGSSISPGISSPGTEAPAPSSRGFAERVADVIAEADRIQKDAEHEAQDLAGGSGRTTETMIALSRAELSMRFVVALRNRAIQAYQEIMRLQV